MIRKFLKNANQGQAIVMIALMFVGLVAMVGIMVDGGTLMLDYARLKRGVDAAAVGAAQQFKQGYTQPQLDATAQEFMGMNQSDTTSIKVDTCKTLTGDPVLCALPLRKLVKVTATQTVNFGFLKILGINSTNISASAVGESASIDMVLVIDTSISMAAETSGGATTIDPGDDPSACNPNACEPMATVKSIADQFVHKLFFPYDRVSIVALTSQTAGGSRDPVEVLPLSISEGTVLNAIDGLRVFQPQACHYTNGALDGPTLGPCLNYPAPANTFAGQECPAYRLSNPNDPTTCNTTDGGDGLSRAGNEFVNPAISVRKNSFWAVIVLLSGTPNSSQPYPADSLTHPNGYCPSTYWPYPFCVQPSMPVSITDPNRHGNGNSNYTSLDYARDMADWVADPKDGQGASIFSIGLGTRVRSSSSTNGADPAEAEKFLQYAAQIAGDATKGSTPPRHGKYYYAPSSSNLTSIFNDIYQNISTKISQ